MLLDTNLLVLLVVGRLDQDLIARHRRLKQFEPEDYDRLLRALAGTDRILVTPNTLTETSNLLSYQRGALGLALAAELRSLIDAEIEIVVPSVVAAARSEFPRLGLADAALAEIASAQQPLLTADMQLFGAVAAIDPQAVRYFRSGEGVRL